MDGHRSCRPKTTSQLLPGHTSITTLGIQAGTERAIPRWVTCLADTIHAGAVCDNDKNNKAGHEEEDKEEEEGVLQQSFNALEWPSVCRQVRGFTQ